MQLTDSGPRSFAEAVDPKHTALVLHDVQNDILVDKASFNDFHDSIADKVLRIQGVETVILTGVSTHAGVIATVFGLLDCGYRYFVPRECVSGYVPELHECALKIIGPYVIPMAQVVEAWSAARGMRS